MHNFLMKIDLQKRKGKKKRLQTGKRKKKKEKGEKKKKKKVLRSFIAGFVVCILFL